MPATVANGGRLHAQAQAYMAALERREDAAALQTAGIRTQAGLQALGEREAEILRTAGQRSISRLWERTQAVLAIFSTISIIGICGYAIIWQTPQAPAAFQLLQSLLILVIATYFQRTNHQKVGGVGLGDSGR